MVWIRVDWTGGRLSSGVVCSRPASVISSMALHRHEQLSLDWTNFNFTAMDIMQKAFPGCGFCPTCRQCLSRILVLHPLDAVMALELWQYKMSRYCRMSPENQNCPWLRITGVDFKINFLLFCLGLCYDFYWKFWRRRLFYVSSLKIYY